MRALHAMFNWMRQVFRSRQFEREMQAEMHSHIEQQAALNRARGMRDDESLAAAKRDFGNVSYLQEQSRDARGTRFVEETKRDLVYGMRALLRTPGFTTVAILSLMLGIGVNTAMFMFGRFAFAPQSLAEAESFVSLRTYVTYPGWQLLARDTTLFAKTVVNTDIRAALVREDGEATPTNMELVSDGYFPMFRGQALLGRLLVPGEGAVVQGATPVVLGFTFWRQAFVGDSSVVGRTIRLTNGSQLTVVGVSARGFAGAGRRPPDMWAPIALRSQIPEYRTDSVRPINWISNTNRKWLAFSAQLAPGVTREQARLRLQPMLSRMPTSDSTLQSKTYEFLEFGGRSYVSSKNIAATSLALSATMMILLIGCANVANLMLARGVTRRREIAVRLSLGASRIRLIRQLMAESILLALLGGTSALALSTAILQILSASGAMSALGLDPETASAALRPDRFIIVFTFAIAFISAVAFGLLPALRSTKMDLSGASRDDGTAFGNKLARSRLRTTLVVGQVAMSLLLLITASVLLQSARNASGMDLGYDRDHVVTTIVSRAENGYSDAQLQEYSRHLEERTVQLYGADVVARGTVPIWERQFARINPASAGREMSEIATASPGYFRVLDIPIVKGRTFTEVEARTKARVAVVSEATAKRLWPSDNPIGKRLTLAEETYYSQADSLRDIRELVVVGVVADAQMGMVGENPTYMIYEPADSGSILVRTSGAVSILRNRLKQAALGTDRNVIASVTTINEMISEHGKIQAADVTSKYTSFLGLLGLALCSLGIFGVVAYTVSQRTREIGVRLAIGAQRSDVLRLVIRQGMRPVIFGLLLGCVGATVAIRALHTMLFGVTGRDPIAYAAACLVVGGVAVVACYVPARRAMLIDPVRALRAE